MSATVNPFTPVSATFRFYFVSCQTILLLNGEPLWSERVKVCKKQSTNWLFCQPKHKSGIHTVTLFAFFLLYFFFLSVKSCLRLLTARWSLVWVRKHSMICLTPLVNMLILKICKGNIIITKFSNAVVKIILYYIMLCYYYYYYYYYYY